MVTYSSLYADIQHAAIFKIKGVAAANSQMNSLALAWWYHILIVSGKTSLQTLEI